jgi:hypothetical protein
MWGGWYNDTTYMAEMKEFLEISKQAVDKPMGSVSEFAVFVDAKANKYRQGGALAYVSREMLGKIGAPYDCYLASDYERVKDRYRAVILIDTYRTPLADHIISDCEKREVGCFIVNAENVKSDPSVVREFCRENGVFIYTDEDAVVYANESYLFVHSCTEAMPAIKAPAGKSIVPIFKGEATNLKHPRFASMLYEFV